MLGIAVLLTATILVIHAAFRGPMDSKETSYETSVLFPLGPSNSTASMLMGSGGRPIPGHLIIVPGHAIYLGKLFDRPAIGAQNDAATAGADEILEVLQDKAYLKDGWLLEYDYQLDQTPHFVMHIMKGVELLKQDPINSLLMFSGGMYGLWQFRLFLSLAFADLGTS